MSTPKKIARNTGFVMVAKVGINVLSALAMIVLARYLGREGFGKFSVIAAYLSFFQILTGLGIDNIVIRELSAENADQSRIVGSAISLKFFCSVVAVLVSWLVLPFMGYGMEVSRYIMIASLAMLFSFSTTFVGLFQQRMKVLHYLVPEFIATGLSLVVMLIIALRSANLTLIVMVQTAAIVPIALAFWVISCRVIHVVPLLSIDRSRWRELLAQSWPIFLSSFFVSINMRIDQVMLYRMQGDAALGGYSAVAKLTESLNFVPVAFSAVMYPFMCESLVRSREKFDFVYRRAFKYMSIAVVPIVCGTMLCADQIMQLFYGITYVGSSSVLAVLIWSEIFIFLGCINGNALIALNLQNKTFFFTAAGALSNVLLNLLLIPRFGALGSAWATVISYGVAGIIPQLVLSSTRALMIDYLASLLRPGLCAVPMAFAVLWLRGYGLFVALPAGTLVYLGALFLLRCLDEHDREYFRQIRSGRNG